MQELTRSVASNVAGSITSGRPSERKCWAAAADPAVTRGRAVTVSARIPLFAGEDGFWGVIAPDKRRTVSRLERGSWNDRRSE